MRRFREEGRVGSRPVDNSAGALAELEAFVQQSLRECGHREQALRGERRWWEELANLLPRIDEEPFALLTHLATVPDSVRQEVLPMLARVRALAEEAAQCQTNQYTELLRRELPAPIRLEGRLNEGYRVNHVIRVRIDDQRRIATIETASNRQRLVGDISPKRVAATIQQEYRRLFDRPFEPAQFIEELFLAYRQALVAEGTARSIGSPVSLFTVHRFVVFLRQPPKLFQAGDRTQFVPYPLDEFAVDLGKLLASGCIRFDRHYLKLHPVRDAKQALHIVNFESAHGQNYGQLSFEPVGGRGVGGEGWRH